MSNPNDHHNRIAQRAAEAAARREGRAIPDRPIETEHSQQTHETVDRRVDISEPVHSNNNGSHLKKQPDNVQPDEDTKSFEVENTESPLKPDNYIEVPAPAAEPEPEHISDTFAELESSLDTPAEASNIDFPKLSAADLASITIEDDTLSDIDLISNREAIMSARNAGYQVSALSSNYTAVMHSLKFEDKSRLSAAQEDAAQYYKRLFLTVFNRLDFKTENKPSFENWLKMTAYSDFETLLFGTYAQTYPGKSAFDISCPKCKTELKPEFQPEHLLHPASSDVESRINSINAHDGSVSSIQANTLVNKVERKLLPDSNVIIDIRTPSLRHHLDLFEKFHKQISGDLSNAFVALMFTKQLLVPNIKRYKQTGEMTYIAVTKPEAIISYFAELSLTDADQLEKLIDGVSSTYQLEFKLPEFDCTSCGYHFESIPIRIEKLLNLKVAGQM